MKQLLEKIEELAKRAQGSWDKAEKVLKQIAELNNAKKVAQNTIQKLQQQTENMTKEKEILLKKQENAEKVLKKELVADVNWSIKKTMVTKGRKNEGTVWQNICSERY